MITTEQICSALSNKDVEFYRQNSQGDLLNDLIEFSKTYPNMAMNLLIRLLGVREKRMIAVFSAQQALPVFEAQYPDDMGPRAALDSALLFLKSGGEVNKVDISLCLKAATKSTFDAKMQSAHRYSYFAAQSCGSAARSCTYEHAKWVHESCYAACAYSIFSSGKFGEENNTEMRNRILGEGVRILEEKLGGA